MRFIDNLFVYIDVLLSYPATIFGFIWQHQTECFHHGRKSYRAFAGYLSHEIKKEAEENQKKQ